VQVHQGFQPVPKAPNARIIPRTVPRRPISTEIEAMVERMTDFSKASEAQELKLLQIPSGRANDFLVFHHGFIILKGHGNVQDGFS